MPPYLSFVMVGRNDTYAGDFVRRMQVSIDTTAELLESHGCNAEIVIVEWNPPADRPGLDETLETPDHVDVPIHIITVPREIHEEFPKSDRIPVFEYAGKNTGIRRADGEFVLATNPDILFNEPLIQFIADERLDQDLFYRVSRYDVETDVSADQSTEDRLSHCARNVYRVSTTNDGFVRTTSYSDESMDFVSDYVSKLATQPRKLLRLRKRRHRSRLWQRVMRVINVQDSADVKDGRSEMSVSRPNTNEELFMLSSGDFMLMHCDGWEEISGYPETATNEHIDSIGCASAVRAGFRQAVLNEPYRIYHQPHPNERANRPGLSTELEAYIDALLTRDKEPMGGPDIDRTDNWGLRGRSLPVTELG